MKHIVYSLALIFLGAEAIRFSPKIATQPTTLIPEGKYVIQVAEHISTEGYYMSVKRELFRDLVKRFGLAIGIGAGATGAIGAAMGVGAGVHIMLGNIFNIFTMSQGLVIFGLASLATAALLVPIYFMVERNMIRLAPTHPLIWDLKHVNGTMPNEFTLENEWQEDTRAISKGLRGSKLSNKGDPIHITARCDDPNELKCYLQIVDSKKWFYAKPNHHVSMELASMTLWKLSDFNKSNV